MAEAKDGHFLFRSVPKNWTEERHVLSLSLYIISIMTSLNCHSVHSAFILFFSTDKLDKRQTGKVKPSCYSEVNTQNGSSSSRPAGLAGLDLSYFSLSATVF